ncbi:MAG: GGDEF domain-containing protein [Blautia sp.]|jgi:diguanylate cyclase (GGDEF)-like protein
MKKRNVVIMVSCVLVCFLALLAIFRGYNIWSEESFYELMYENQKAYTISQKTELTDRVEDIRNTLKTLVAVLEDCDSEEEIHKYDPVMEAMGSNENILVEKVAYYSFSEIYEKDLNEKDRNSYQKLKRGEFVISGIKKNEKVKKAHCQVAEPVFLNGNYVGFISGMVLTDILLYSSQSGFFRDDTEGYLAHKNGNLVMLDYLEEDKILNIFENLKTVCTDKEALEQLQSSMENGEDFAIIRNEAEGAPVFISCVSLPYNDWIIINTTASDRNNRYITDMARRGRNASLTVLLIAGGMIAILLSVYYLSNKKQRFEQKRSSLLAKFSDMALCEYAEKKDRIKCTSNIIKMLDLPDTVMEHFSRYVKEERLIHPDDIVTAKEMLANIPCEDEIKEYELRLKNSSGQYNWYSIQVAVLYVKEKIQDCLIMKITDISETKEEVLGLRKKSRTDVLTGLLNREVFQSRVEAYIKAHHSGYLFILDLDEFKHINDKFGHQTGDRVLQISAECLKQCFRSEDDTARYGGDEFLAFMPGTASRESVNQRAGKLLKLISQIKIEEIPELVLTGSVGIAQYEGEDYKEFLERADRAMYRAKEQGKNLWLLE